MKRLACLTALPLALAGACNGGNLDPTFENVDELVGARCANAGCHDATTKAESLDLSGDWHAAMVGVESAKVAGLTLIVAGNADDSYLVNKLEGTQAAVGGEGANMPLTGGALSADQIDMIATWIDDGALQ